MEIEAVEPAEAGPLRAQLLDWLSTRDRKSIAVAAGYAGTDGAGLARAIEQVLSTGRPAAQRKLTARLIKERGTEGWRKAFFIDPLPTGLQAVRLRATRLGAAFHYPGQDWVPYQTLQLLLEAKGAEALHKHVNTDHLRFCRRRRLDIADKIAAGGFATQPERTLRRGTVHGELRFVVVLPKALVPKGCKPGAKFKSIAPANDGIVGGKLLRGVSPSGQRESSYTREK